MLNKAEWKSYMLNYLLCKIERKNRFFKFWSIKKYIVFNVHFYIRTKPLNEIKVFERYTNKDYQYLTQTIKNFEDLDVSFCNFFLDIWLQCNLNVCQNQTKFSLIHFSQTHKIPTAGSDFGIKIQIKDLASTRLTSALLFKYTHSTTQLELLPYCAAKVRKQ